MKKDYDGIATDHVLVRSRKRKNIYNPAARRSRSLDVDDLQMRNTKKEPSITSLHPQINNNLNSPPITVTPSLDCNSDNNNNVNKDPVRQGPLAPRPRRGHGNGIRTPHPIGVMVTSPRNIVDSSSSDDKIDIEIVKLDDNLQDKNDNDDHYHDHVNNVDINSNINHDNSNNDKVSSDDKKDENSKSNEIHQNNDENEEKNDKSQNENNNKQIDNNQDENEKESNSVDNDNNEKDDKVNQDEQNQDEQKQEQIEETVINKNEESDKPKPRKPENKKRNSYLPPTSISDEKTNFDDHTFTYGELMGIIQYLTVYWKKMKPHLVKMDCDSEVKYFSLLFFNFFNLYYFFLVY